MSKLVVVTHPNINQSLVNRLWVEELSSLGEDVKVHSLYEKYPDLKFDVEAEQALLSKYDEIIFQFPIHWFNVPFALKKYIDEVLAYGWAFGPGGDNMKGKKIRMAASTGGNKEAYEGGVSLDDLLQPMAISFKFCGCDVLPTHRIYGASHGLAEETIKTNAKEYSSAILA
ncbi:NAD(P)H-dependent oxidoreductase [Mangrovibacterium diazotrophicum]|uniref:Putative NADPH-quinone reductase n=1 Tax=Mangrovibacterium diazotrophicum TaxID=1261403 RepID=A0A419VWS8_9BACT|nr:NAD(P)H-dependent oxidoreductase [Mangrovibacterium diazotrophicum]RKD87693.1 putative NADPH-quinone reductase [Mangrovibacterium diazotrophicum]